MVKKTRKKKTKVRSASKVEVLGPEKEPSNDRSLKSPARSSQIDMESDLFESEDQEDENQDPDDLEITETEEETSHLPATTSDHDLSSVSAQDPLRRYLEELRKYPTLDLEEEQKLALRLKENGDLSAAKALVSANLRLVVKIAFEYRTFYSNVLDLIQEGNVGLMKAVSRYDPTRGAKLGYYASWWIRSYILKYLLDNFRLVRVGTTQAQKKLFYHLMREKQKLEAQGVLAGPKLLAEKLNVREKDVIEMEQRLAPGSSDVSLDAPLRIDDGDRATTHGQLIEAPMESIEDRLENEQLLQLLKDQLPQFQKDLNEREIQILQERLLAEKPKTLQEIADDYGLTRERTRQIEAKVIEKLREFLKAQL